MTFNPATKRKIVRDGETGEHLPCVMCGTRHPLPDSVHIIDRKEWRAAKGADAQENGMPLCPNCHRIFDEVLRPYLFRALEAFGATGLPESWRRNNKITVTEKRLPVEE